MRAREARTSASWALQLGLKTRVLEREARGGPDGLEELGLVLERRVVDDRSDASAVVLEHGDGASLSSRRSSGLPSEST